MVNGIDDVERLDDKKHIGLTIVLFVAIGICASGAYILTSPTLSARWGSVTLVCLFITMVVVSVFAFWW